jgi:hypothetical protein
MNAPRAGKRSVKLTSPKRTRSRLKRLLDQGEDVRRQIALDLESLRPKRRLDLLMRAKEIR